LCGERMDDSNIRVNYTPGRLPTFWDRSVIFFANLMALFYGNEGATQELTDCVGGVETYGGRLCPLINVLFAGGENLLVLESEPDEALLQYFAQELDLDLPEVVVLPHSRYLDLAEILATHVQADNICPSLDPALEESDDSATLRISRHPAKWIDGFVTDEVLTDAARILDKQTIIVPAASHCGNNKLRLHRFLEQAGFPTFDTVIIDSAQEFPRAAETLRQMGYRKIVAKAQVGASGIGMHKFDSATPAIDVLGETMFYEGEVLVQGWLDASCEEIESIGSPSMQLFLDETTANIYDVTEQILSEESVHEGNCSPPPFWCPEIESQMHEQTAAVCRWLHENGYRGTASVDFLVVKRKGEFRVFVCEVNARVTGATYPSVLARRFCPEGHWLMRNLRIDVPIPSAELLANLRDNAHLLNSESKQGVLPVNFNLHDDGLVSKGQFLCVGADEHTCLEYLMEAAAVLPVKWTYDRD